MTEAVTGIWCLLQFRGRVRGLRQRTATSFTCSICQQSYSSGAHLKRHYKTHFGIYPYTCPICGKGSTNSSWIRAHITKHGEGATPVNTGQDYQLQNSPQKQDSHTSSVSSYNLQQLHEEDKHIPTEANTVTENIMDTNCRESSTPKKDAIVKNEVDSPVIMIKPEREWVIGVELTCRLVIMC